LTTAAAPSSSAAQSPTESASQATTRHGALPGLRLRTTTSSPLARKAWNFKHIVNLDRIRGYNSVNLRLGYALLEIRSPQEVRLAARR
jgi:hypothetical protein